MERKRVKGRFVAEDKGGVVKKQIAAPEPAPDQHQAVPPSRAKSLVGTLLDKWKQRSRTNVAQ